MSEHKRMNKQYDHMTLGDFRNRCMDAIDDIFNEMFCKGEQRE